MDLRTENERVVDQFNEAIDRLSNVNESLTATRLELDKVSSELISSQLAVQELEEQRQDCAYLKNQLDDAMDALDMALGDASNNAASRLCLELSPNSRPRKEEDGLHKKVDVYHANGLWFCGTIAKICPKTCAIDFADGERAARVQKRDLANCIHDPQLLVGSRRGSPSYLLMRDLLMTR